MEPQTIHPRWLVPVHWCLVAGRELHVLLPIPMRSSFAKSIVYSPTYSGSGCILLLCCHRTCVHVRVREVRPAGWLLRIRDWPTVSATARSKKFEDELSGVARCRDLHWHVDSVVRQKAVCGEGDDLYLLCGRVLSFPRVLVRRGRTTEVR